MCTTTGITTGSTDHCDKCGRSLEGKGYINISGWKICGVCQYEIILHNEMDNKSNQIKQK